MLEFPNINITFVKSANNVLQNNTANTVGLAILDDQLKGQSFVLQNVNRIPSEFTPANTEFVKNAFIGNDYAPNKVLVYCYGATTNTLDDALKFFELNKANFIAINPTATASDITKAITWVKATRGEIENNVFLVIPKQTVASNHEGVIEYDGTVTVGGVVKTAAQYCSRIAGLLAGTDMKKSATFARLPEVEACSTVKDKYDELTGAGVNYVFFGGTGFKFSRAVTSLTTLGTKSAEYQKIKIAGALGMIGADLYNNIADNFVGQYPNNLDSQMILVSAISNYLQVMVTNGVVNGGYSVELDVNAKREYLFSKGINVDAMNDTEVLNYIYDSKVFIKIVVSVLDAIEDVIINVNI